MTTRPSSRAGDFAHFVALLATAIALGGALAHAFELPHKIDMDRETYFTVQQIYAGWNRLAFVLLFQAGGIIGVLALSRGQRGVRSAAAVALAALILAQVVFWVWTYPANQLTANWTITPENWRALREQWEYSHLSGAGFQLLAMIALIIAALRRVHDADRTSTTEPTGRERG